MDHEEHGTSCSCPHHRSTATTTRSAGAWSFLLPILACAVCPGCLATYAKLLSALGIGVLLTESQHLWMLLGCVAVSLGLGLREVRTTGRRGPFVVTSIGCTSLLGGHVLGDVAWLTWGGVALLLAGSVWGHRVRYRRPVPTPRPVRSFASPRLT